MSTASNYSLHKLMEISEMSVSPVFQTGSSRAEFFEYMDSLLALADRVLNEYSMIQPGEEGKRKYLMKLSTLQSRFIDLNATKAVWEIEQFSQAFKSEDHKHARQCFLAMSETLYQLCKKIRKAQIALPYEQLEKDSGNWPLPPEDAQMDRLAAIPRRELFEKVLVLIQSMEINHALEQLQTLESLKFSDEIDGALIQIHKDLLQFAYDDAIIKVENLIQALDSIGADAECTRKKILVIDDMPIVLISVKTMLEAQYSVFCVTNHMAALKYLAQGTVDLILLDIEMPDMDGFTLLHIIRKMDRYKDIPVIFLTGNASPEYLKKAIAQGGNDFIKKPVDKQTLLVRLAKQLK